MTPEDITVRIRKALPDADVQIVDTTGGGDHFSATVVSSAFADKGLVDRHRLVYAALAEVIHGPRARRFTPWRSPPKPPKNLGASRNRAVR
jgi:stress-induced morphogen